MIEGIPNNITPDQLKGLSAATASSGSVALFHILGVTPEGSTYEDAFQGKEPLRIIDIGEEELLKAQQTLTTVEEGKVDLVLIGCPHASIPEVQKLVQVLDGRRIFQGVEFWVQTNRTVSYWLEQTGLQDRLNFSGIKVITDTCIFGWPLDNWDFKLSVTNSAKFAHYAPGLLQTQVIFCNLEKCVEAAVKGAVRRR